MENPKLCWLVVVFAGVVGCGGSGSDTGVQVAPQLVGRVLIRTSPLDTAAVPASTDTAAANATRQLYAIALNASDGIIAGSTAAWASSNTGVATVNTQGLVTVAGPGATVISATVGGVAGIHSIMFIAPPPPPKVRAISVSPQFYTLNVNVSAVFAASVDADHGADLSVTWSSSNPSVVAIDGTGKITGKAAGTATITATSVADPSVFGTARATVPASP